MPPWDFNCSIQKLADEMEKSHSQQNPNTAIYQLTKYKLATRSNGTNMVTIELPYLRKAQQTAW